MPWNYRVLRKKIDRTNPDQPHGDRDPEALAANTTEYDFAIYEVYYDENGIPNGSTEYAYAPGGESLDELRRAIESYAEALGKPVLNYKTLEEIKEGDRL